MIRAAESVAPGVGVTDISQLDKGAPCADCPWTSGLRRDVLALTEDVKQSAIDGKWFCCHVNLGTCHGARRFGNAKRKLLSAGTST